MSPWSVIQEIRRKVSEEEGVLCKEAALRIALCHPTPYTAAMSSLGFQTIYREIHRHPNTSADRAFLPDEPATYRKTRTPILTYENETPISEFPIIAFSIAYELELPGIFEMLDLSGIPLLRQDRTERHPLIIAGGPLTYSNPAILYPFVDLVILGEGEDLVHSLLDSAVALNRKGLLSLFSRHPGCHVPGMTSGTPELAKARDEQLPAFSQILTKNTVLASMFLIEPERGCSRSCAFCVMRCATNGGMRLVSPEKVFSLIPENARRVGLVGAAVTDHPGILELIRKIVLSGREIGVSSLRADRLNKELVELLARGGYQTLTTASDGASQRVRDLTGRNISEQHLIRAAELVRDTGLRRLKLYEMIGLPGESMDDIDELVRFSRELSRIAPLSLSISPFVAKKNTPLDGAPFESIPKQMAKLAMIRNGLKGKADVKPASPRWAWVEYMLSQGDESAGLAAMEAWRTGGTFASWKQAFADLRGDPLRAR
jgi:radical SAM superfamily enzyme YgiQ (UPF0313 family)